VKVDRKRSTRRDQVKEIKLERAAQNQGANQSPLQKRLSPRNVA